MKYRITKTSLIQIIVGLLLVCLTAAIYVGQLNKAVVNNTMATISELAQHDKRSIESFIETCWDELDGVAQRFYSYNCQTIIDVEARMNLECSTSDFTHIYLVAEDGKVYTDKYVVYDPAQNTMNRQINLLPYFSGGQERVVTRWDDKSDGAGLAREYVLYGIRLEDFEVEGIKMRALIGLSDTRTIQNHIVLDSFVQDGVRHGYSAVVSRSGNYIIGAQKTLYLNETDNMYMALAAGSQAELTNAQVESKIQNLETFSFHYVDANNVKKLLYFIPFENDINWYFMMAVENQAFTAQSQQFVLLSVIMMCVILLVVMFMVSAMTMSHNKTLQAMASARAQSEFLSNMSHEIRTPLNGLIGLNHLVLTHIDEPEDTEKIKDWLHKTHSTANYLLSLVNDVLDMSKLQAGKVDLINEPLLLETLLDAVWSMQRDNIANRGVNFVLEPHIDVPCIIGDNTRIKQVLMNIVGNAAKFTPKGGQITLTVWQEPIDETHVNTFFRCKDTGVGMSSEFLGKIFDTFSQERSKNADSVKGTGLGMAISKLLATAMGGDIQVESELGRGTTFTMRLPSEIAAAQPDYLDQHTPENQAEADAIAEAMHTGRPVKVLVAEDNALNAEILLDILTEEGFEVVHAENGQEAVAQFVDSQVGEFDIILMDMQMPVMDGCEASRTIRGLDRPDAGRVAIYACTANTFKEDRDRALDSGMDDFLTKPIDVEILLNKIKAGIQTADNNKEDEKEV